VSAVGSIAAAHGCVYPIYLDFKAEAFLRKLADQRGTEVGQIVNEWIRKAIDLIKSAR